jgi:hypothetical protein
MMAKLDKTLAVVIDSLTDEQLERKVTELKDTIPQLNLQLDHASMRLKERRAAAMKKKVDDARRTKSI